MARKRWIEVVSWDRFQHYTNRQPVWVKNYTRLLDDPNYLQLTGQQRAVLHGLWMLYAKTGRSIPYSTEIVNRWLGLRIKMSTLEALNHAGFIRVRASKPLATRYQVEVEVLRTSTKSDASARRNSGASVSEKKNSAVCPECGIGAGRHLQECSRA